MDKANIIISIIVVLCVAAAVAAYGITNSDNPIFSDLSSMSSKDTSGNGLGNNTTAVKGNSSSAINAGGGSGSGSGSGPAGPSDGGSGSGGGSSSYNGGNDYGSSDSDSSDSGSSSSSTSLSYSEAQSIANSAVAEPGCYAGGGYYSDGYWYFTIYDENGNAVDTISVSDSNGGTGRG